MRTDEHGSGKQRSAVAWTVLRVLAELVGFAVLLFLTRFLARAHLIPQSDQECHIGGIAVDVLTHGIRFPLLAYAPNEYDNGSFFSGLLTTGSFSILGRNVLALKLATHIIAAAGAVGALWLLRACLRELGLTARRVRWVATAALVIAFACAPRVVTLTSMNGVGNHAEGAAIDTILLAVFAYGVQNPSAARAAVRWVLVGAALYLNKGTALAIPVLAAAEMVFAWPYRRRVAAAATGFALGAVPEVLVVAQRHALGWATMATKPERSTRSFPKLFVDDLLFLGEYRVELLAAWAVALAIGIVLFVRAARRFTSRRAGAPTAGPPVALGLVVGFTCLFLVALAVMAQGGLDAYEIYGYATLVILYALSLALACARATARWNAGLWIGAAAIGVTLLLYRPDAVTGGLGAVTALWQNQAGAACGWRFAEGFAREHDHGLAPHGLTRAEHAIARCRSLPAPTLPLDCIGGIARELAWRRGSRVDPEPPADLSPTERRAYAYFYGTHRRGDDAPCSDFRDADLAAHCRAAVQLECLVFGDLYTRVRAGERLRSPRCTISDPPADGYWAAMRRDLLARDSGPNPEIRLASTSVDADLRACRTVFERCYGSTVR